MHTLSVHNLSARIDGTAILKDISLTIKSGEIHILMGQNGSGKSTLAGALMGRPDITIIGGTATIDEVNVLALPPHKRALAGLFLAFQQPIALPGVSVGQCMRLSLREAARASGTEFDGAHFRAEFENALHMLGIDRTFAERGLNDGFSGGEKKRMELLQMLLMKPRIALLDEIDSGLDVDGLKLIARALHALIVAHNTGVLYITHNPNLLETITPRRVHVMHGGRIVATGDAELAQHIAKNGYAQFTAN